MILYPAIDLREGKCVRLYQGRLDEQTVFSDDPVAMAVKWETLGAPWLHVVDLDGAFSGVPQNLEVIRELVRRVNIPVQMGGGIRSLEIIQQVLSLGVERVVIGTVAISHPELVAKACDSFGERISVGIDSKHGLVAVEGWEATVEKTAVELGLQMKEIGVTRLIHTDTSRDGAMTGPNLNSTRELTQATGLKVIASGGIASLEDIRAVKELEPLGVEGVILGRSLYTGNVELIEALDLASGNWEA